MIIEFVKQFIHTRRDPQANTPSFYPYTDYYSYTYYRWDTASHTPIGAVSGTNYPVSSQQVTGTGTGQGNQALYIQGTAPYVYYMPYRVIETFQAPVYNPVNNTSPNKTVRAHHASSDPYGPLVGLTVLETHNPLEVDVNPALDISSITPTNDPGSFRLHVRPVDRITPIETSYIVQGIPVPGIILRAYLRPQGSTAQPQWQTMQPAPNQNGLDVYYAFSVTTAGTYEYQVRAYFNDSNEPLADWSTYYPVMSGTVTVTQAQAISATMEFVPGAIDSTPTGHGLATGILRPQIQVTYTGSNPVDITMQLLQDGDELDLPHNATRVGTSDVFEAEFNHIPAGFYTVKAKMRNASSLLERTHDGQVLPPPLEIGDQLSFLPWVQPTLTYDAVTLAATGGYSGTRPQVPLSATLTTDGNLATQRTEFLASAPAEIAGPGDVQGLTERGILSVWPAPDASGCSPLELVQLDFKDEDMPWRFSTLRRAQYDKTFTSDNIPLHLPAAPLPWCCLMVLKNGDATTREYDTLEQTSEPLARIRVRSTAVYPSAEPKQQELWAHVQLNTTLPQTTVNGELQPPTAADVDSFLNTTLSGAPDLACSRLLSPRRLTPDTAYTAFLVPALEAGRKAGLGQSFAAADLTTPAMPATGASVPAIEFPVYYQWNFTTGAAEDFESLVDQLHPAQDSTNAALAPALGLTTSQGAAYELPMPSLLVDTTTPATSAADLPLVVAKDLYNQLEPSFSGTRPVNGRPVVAPPLYGRAYMVTPRLSSPVTSLPTSWKHQLNLDPRYRALAALGTEVVRENQEEYVRRAWEQVQDILLANEKLRGAQYGLRTSSGLRDQHLPLTTITTVTTTGFGGGSASAQARGGVVSESESNGFQSEEGVVATPTTTTTQSAGMAEYGLHLTGLALSRVRMGVATGRQPAGTLTARETIRRSNVPLAAFSPTFRRIAKPFGNYLVGQAGRPLRPTQPEPTGPIDSAMRGPQLRGTSLRQRDQLLSGLTAGSVVPTPNRAEQLRVYQFRDDTVDKYLTQLTSGAASASAAFAPAGWNAGDVAKFRAAFDGFRSQGPVGPNNVQLVGFRKPRYQRPALTLPALLADMVAGTAPSLHFTKKIQQVSPVVVPPMPVNEGHYEGSDFNASHFYVGDFDEPTNEYDTTPTNNATTANSNAQRTSSLTGGGTSVTQTSTSADATAPATDGSLPVIAQAKVFPVFKDAMGELLRQRHPELFVPGLGGFPAGGVAVLDVNQRFIEAYMVGLNHALGSELSWRGFPVDLRGTFFQQFWDVSEHLNHLPATADPAAVEASLVDIKPLSEWLAKPLGGNAPDTPVPAPDVVTLRLALRSELLRRYPTMVLALQLTSLVQPPVATTAPDPTNQASLLLPRQRLAVGQDLAIITFEVPRPNVQTDDTTTLAAYSLLLMERPGQPKFGFDADAPDPDHPGTNPLSWDDLSGEYLDSLGLTAGQNLSFYLDSVNPLDPLANRPRATAEPSVVATLVDSARVAYALFQEPVLGSVSLPDLLT